MNTDDKQKYLEEFNRYFPPEDREDGIIKEIKEDLEKIKQTNNFEKKHEVSRFARKKHENNMYQAQKCYVNGGLEELGVSKYDTVEKYKKLVRKLDDLSNELDLESMRKPKSQSIRKHFCPCCQTNLFQNEFICNKKECLEKIQAEINQKLRKNNLDLDRKQNRTEGRPS